MHLNMFVEIPLEKVPQFSNIRCEGIFVVELFGKEGSLGDWRILP